jgi:hypothetical protein
MTPAHEALIAIAKRDGVVTPTAVLQDAADETSPLHRLFEWDDTAAAERYRLDQARGLIRRYRVIHETKPEETVRVRAFSSVGGGAYKPTEDALRVVEDRDFILGQAIRELAALRRKYEHLIDFDAAIQASAEIVKKARRGEAA